MRAWTALLHIEHGWLARHPNETIAIVLALVIFAPGAIQCLPY
jgi:hypothetical protein